MSGLMQRLLTPIVRPIVVAVLDELSLEPTLPDPALRRSRVFRDASVREAADRLYRDGATIDEALSSLRQRFGNGRAPSRSSLGRYFQKLKAPAHV